MTGTPDREKVVKGLECCLSNKYPSCSECGYYGDMRYNDALPCRLSLMADTLAALRRTPAVWEYYTNDEGRARWKCSACGKIIRHGANEKRFCSACGAEMRMEC